MSLDVPSRLSWGLMGPGGIEKCVEMVYGTCQLWISGWGPDCGKPVETSLIVLRWSETTEDWSLANIAILFAPTQQHKS